MMSHHRHLPNSKRKATRTPPCGERPICSGKGTGSQPRSFVTSNTAADVKPPIKAVILAMGTPTSLTPNMKSSLDKRSAKTKPMNIPVSPAANKPTPAPAPVPISISPARFLPSPDPLFRLTSNFVMEVRGIANLVCACPLYLNSKSLRVTSDFDVFSRYRYMPLASCLPSSSRPLQLTRCEPLSRDSPTRERIR